MTDVYANSIFHYFIHNWQKQIQFYLVDDNLHDFKISFFYLILQHNSA